MDAWGLSDAVMIMKALGMLLSCLCLWPTHRHHLVILLLYD
jgi:hypothetical protein